MTTAKNAVFIGLSLEKCYLVGGNWLLVGPEQKFGSESLLRGIFVGGGMRKFSAGGGLPHAPSMGKSCIMCPLQNVGSVFVMMCLYYGKTPGMI